MLGACSGALATPSPTAAPTTTLDALATQSTRATATYERHLADITDTLDQAGLVASEGHVAWAGFDPREVRTGNEYIVSNQIAGNHDYGDFVFHSKVTWDTSTGMAGCGVIFRSEPDLANGEQVVFITHRITGAPFWNVALRRHGELQSSLSGGFQAGSAMHSDVNSANEFVLVAMGDQLTAYANGSRLGTVTNLTRDTGRMAVLAWRESGHATCTFEDTWIWVPGNG
jgi:hypothetical protein